MYQRAFASVFFTNYSAIWTLIFICIELVMFEVVSNWCRGGDVQLQNRVVDKPVKCYSESDGVMWLSD